MISRNGRYDEHDRDNGPQMLAIAVLFSFQGLVWFAIGLGVGYILWSAAT
jgi:hypothetical protein